MFLPFVCGSDVISRAAQTEGPWPGFLFQYDCILLSVPLYPTPTTYFYFFLNSHSIQKPLHLLCGPSQITCPGYPTNKMSVSLPVKAPEAESHPAEKWIYFTAVSLTWHQTCTNLWMHIYNPPPFSSFPACFLFFKLKVNWEAGTFASHKGRPYFML